MKKPVVALLSGGLSSEDYLSRRTARYVYRLLQETPYDIQLLDWKKDGTMDILDAPEGASVRHWKSLLHCFQEYRPHAVFNCLHGEKENAGQLQGFFQLCRIPLTGNELAPSVVGMDKMLTKDLFRRMDIPTPGDSFLGHLHSMDLDRAGEKLTHCGLDFPFILKASHGGSSEGVALVESEGDYHRLLREWAANPDTRYCPLFLEEFIRGEEYCVGVFGHWDQDELHTLPLAEISYNGKIFDKTVKYANDYEVRMAPPLADPLREKMSRWARDIHRVLRFSGFSRMDYKVKDGVPYALEVNTHPGMSSKSIVPKMIAHNPDFDIRAALVHMIEWAVRDAGQS